MGIVTAAAAAARGLNPLLSEAGFSTMSEWNPPPPRGGRLNPLLSEAGFSTGIYPVALPLAQIGLNPLLSEAGFSTGFLLHNAYRLVAQS